MNDEPQVRSDDSSGRERTALELRANRMFLAFRDMEETLDFIAAHEEVLKLSEAAPSNTHLSNAASGSLMAAIVSYSRPFYKNRSAGYADSRLDIAPIMAGFPELAALHELIVERRSQAAAHSDWVLRKTLLLKDSQGNLVRMVSVPAYGKGIQIPKFRQLVEHVISWLQLHGQALDEVVAQTDPSAVGTYVEGDVRALRNG